MGSHNIWDIFITINKFTPFGKFPQNGLHIISAFNIFHSPRVW